jgi:hypothetical protein
MIAIAASETQFESVWESQDDEVRDLMVEALEDFELETDYIEDLSERESVWMAQMIDLPNPLVGYFSIGWGSGSTGPEGANIGATFTGFSAV